MWELESNQTKVAERLLLGDNTDDGDGMLRKVTVKCTVIPRLTKIICFGNTLAEIFVSRNVISRRFLQKIV